MMHGIHDKKKIDGVISVVFRFFRLRSYFHARDNRLTVTLWSHQTFSKH